MGLHGTLGHFGVVYLPGMLARMKMCRESVTAFFKAKECHYPGRDTPKVFIIINRYIYIDVI